MHVLKLVLNKSMRAFDDEQVINKLQPKVKGQFINNNTRTTAEKEIMKNHLTKHYNNIRDLKLQYDTRNKIQSNIGTIFTKMLIRFIDSSLRTERLKSFKVKNNKIFHLTKCKPVPKYPEHKVPITNLSSHQLTETKY